MTPNAQRQQTEPECSDDYHCSDSEKQAN